MKNIDIKINNSFESFKFRVNGILIHKEETGYDVKVNKLICITENFFSRKNGEKIQELGFYYLLDLENQKEIDYNVYKKIDENIELQLKWFSMNGLENIDFKPKELKEKIENKNIDFEHLIINNY